MQFTCKPTVKPTLTQRATEMLINQICCRRLAVYSISVGDKLLLSRSGETDGLTMMLVNPAPASEGFHMWFPVQIPVVPKAVDNMAYFGLCSLRIS